MGQLTPLVFKGSDTRLVVCLEVCCSLKKLCTEHLKLVDRLSWRCKCVYFRIEAANAGQKRVPCRGKLLLQQKQPGEKPWLALLKDLVGDMFGVQFVEGEGGQLLLPCGERDSCSCELCLRFVLEISGQPVEQVS